MFPYIVHTIIIVSALPRGGGRFGIYFADGGVYIARTAGFGYKPDGRLYGNDVDPCYSRSLVFRRVVLHSRDNAGRINCAALFNVPAEHGALLIRDESRVQMVPNRITIEFRRPYARFFFPSMFPKNCP